MQDTHNHNPVIIRTEVDTALPVRESPKAGTYPIPWGAGKAKLGDFVHLARQIIYKTLGCRRVIQCDVGVNIGEVGLRRFRNV
jgi:hypothetical protein